jgi:Family of unknown function (DUF6526)
MPKPQTLATHTKFDSPFHFFVLPVLLVNVGLAIRPAVRFPGWNSAWWLVVCLALLVFAGRTRAFATKLQDRIIRLEERLRLAALLQEPLRSRIGALEDSQLIGLRFASDVEVPALVKRALDEKLSRKDIKKTISEWRADYARV